MSQIYLRTNYEHLRDYVKIQPASLANIFSLPVSAGNFAEAFVYGFYEEKPCLDETVNGNYQKKI